jgi:hypothetical protein
METVLHVSGGTTTHHQERKQLYLQHLVAIAAVRNNGVTPDAVDTGVCAPDNGSRYHTKHVEQFPNKINCVTLHLVGYISGYRNDLTQRIRAPQYYNTV